MRDPLLAAGPAAPSGATELGVGPIGLAVEAESAWCDALVDIERGFAGGPWPSTGVRVDVRLRSGGAPSGSRALPRFVADGDGDLTDHSEVWDATMRLEARRVRATFDLRSRRTEPHVRRELVLAALRCTLATAAPLADGLLLHGAALAHEGGALVFVGASGQGKTTMTRRLSGWRALSDDASLIALDGDGALVAGTPLRGKEGLSRDGRALPLRGVVVLDKGAAELALAPLSVSEAVAALLPRIFWYATAPALEARLMDVLAALMSRLPCWRLSSSLEHDVAPILTRAMR